MTTLDLTERELQILRLSAQGKTYRQTAQELGVSFHTIKNAWELIRAKLGANSKFVAIQKAKELGLL
jgi:DNA-binding CsgD family transcriptional regulator